MGDGIAGNSRGRFSAAEIQAPSYLNCLGVWVQAVKGKLSQQRKEQFERQGIEFVL